MIKQITTKYLRKIRTCEEGVIAFENQTETDPIAILRLCLKSDRWDWANWLITRLMTHKQQVEYAMYAAELAISKYEKMSSNPAPRKAIDATKEWLRNPSEENSNAAYTATNTAIFTAAYAPAQAAASATVCATAFAAHSIANFTYNAYAASDAADYAAGDDAALQQTIIEYGIKLLQT